MIQFLQFFIKSTLMKPDILFEAVCQKPILKINLIPDLRDGTSLIKTNISQVQNLKNNLSLIQLIFEIPSLNILNEKNIPDFKDYIRKDLKRPRYNHFTRENKLSNSLLTKTRMGRSDLTQHKFTVGLVDSPKCDCLFREESPLHYFLDCFLYLPERRVLLNLFEHYIPKFKKFTKRKQLDIL